MIFRPWEPDAPCWAPDAPCWDLLGARCVHSCTRPFPVSSERPYQVTSQACIVRNDFEGREENDHRVTQTNLYLYWICFNKENPVFFFSF